MYYGVQFNFITNQPTCTEKG